MSSIEEKIAVLRLINTPRIGIKTFYQLTGEYGSAERAVAEVAKGGKYKPWSRERALEEIRKADSLSVAVILYDDDDYPPLLKNISDPPPVLYAKGNLQALHYSQAVAIVGSRAASINGRKIAAKLAKELTENGVCVVSGMARGIDAAAHKGAMYACNENGATIAVLGTGVDVVYPEENLELYRQITVNGCILSELPLGTQALAGQFPRRNRIVAGLAQGVLVVEAGLKSGSLITAELAKEQQKLLFAVPGTPGESRSQGSNQLIKDGAALVEDASDILPFLKGNKIQSQPIKRTAEQKVLVFENNDVTLSEKEPEPTGLVGFLTVDGVDIDELIRLSGKDAATVATEILDLEMQGLVERRSGNKVALINQN